MTQATIFHNPRCSKSRATLQILRQHKLDLEVIEYLREPPTVAELDHILTLLDVEPRLKGGTPLRMDGVNLLEGLEMPDAKPESESESKSETEPKPETDLSD